MEHIEIKIDEIIDEIMMPEYNIKMSKELLQEYLDSLESDEERLYFLSNFPSDKSFYKKTNNEEVFYSHYEGLQKLNKHIKKRLLPKYQQSETNAQPVQPELKQFQTELLKKWILTDKIGNFNKIEKELFERNYIDNNYKWGKYKKELCKLVYILIEYRYFRQGVVGIPRVKQIHYIHFISERYRLGKIGLSATWKNFKKDIKTKGEDSIIKDCMASFYWIKTHL